MNKVKFHVVIECNGTSFEDLKEYLQFIVLPSIEKGNETEAIKIKGNPGRWSAYLRPLKPEYKQTTLDTTTTAETKTPAEAPVKEPKRKFPWFIDDRAKLDFIKWHEKDFKILTQLRHENGVLRGDNPLVKELGTLARQKLGYSKKSSSRDIIVLLHNLYLKTKNNDN